MFEYYKDDLQTDNMNIYKAEFDTRKFIILKIQEAKRPDTIEKNINNDNYILFKYLYILLQLYALIPGINRRYRTFYFLPQKLIKT